MGVPLHHFYVIARYSSMLFRVTKCLRATWVPSSAPLLIRRSTVTRVTRRYAAVSFMVTRPSGRGVDVGRGVES